MIDLSRTPWRRLELSTRHSIWCLVDAVDYDWLLERTWNYGWKNGTRTRHYAKRNIGAARTTIYMHREILLRARPDELELAATHVGDHKNGNTLDNRRVNLRWLTVAENARHQVAIVPTLDDIVARLVAGLERRGEVLEEVPF
jgi:HNH endonuclease